MGTTLTVSDHHEPTTEELRLVQREKEHDETALAGESELPGEEHTHERRADKAAYLREKLEEQQAADAER
jgi:predicted phosphodiesterase